jgi:hypothetical protein
MASTTNVLCHMSLTHQPLYQENIINLKRFKPPSHVLDLERMTCNEGRGLIQPPKKWDNRHINIYMVGSLFEIRVAETALEKLQARV